MNIVIYIINTIQIWGECNFTNIIRFPDINFTNVSGNPWTLTTDWILIYLNHFWFEICVYFNTWTFTHCHIHTLTYTLSPINPHLHTFTYTPSPTHFHLHTLTYTHSPTHHHLHTFTYAPSPTHIHLRTLTNTLSPTHFHLRTLTYTLSPTHFHLHTLTYTLSPTHLIPELGVSLSTYIWYTQCIQLYAINYIHLK